MVARLSGWAAAVWGCAPGLASFGWGLIASRYFGSSTRPRLDNWRWNRSVHKSRQGPRARVRERDTSCETQLRPRGGYCVHNRLGDFWGDASGAHDVVKFIAAIGDQLFCHPEHLRKFGGAKWPGLRKAPN